jgi:hypothetical protein
VKFVDCGPLGTEAPGRVPILSDEVGEANVGDFRRTIGAALPFGKIGPSRRRLLTGGTALGAYILALGPAGAQGPPHDHDHMSETLGLVPALVAAMDQPLVE